MATDLAPPLTSAWLLAALLLLAARGKSPPGRLRLPGLPAPPPGSLLRFLDTQTLWFRFLMLFMLDLMQQTLKL